MVIGLHASANCESIFGFVGSNFDRCFTGNSVSATNPPHEQAHC
jgi:hypothetical protein